jgi:hypothetical protein
LAGLIELKYINSLPQETKKILYKGCLEDEIGIITGEKVIDKIKRGS